ncbi:hypothetical protein AADR41_22180 [Streptomyces sp. CLV115]|uniref:hypothetical protein n=1 Tax=Streptomyces sp. CLV115 TaxID=3138502 RepID=UPI00313ECDC3
MTSGKDSNVPPERDLPVPPPPPHPPSTTFSAGDGAMMAGQNITDPVTGPSIGRDNWGTVAGRDINRTKIGGGWWIAIVAVLLTGTGGGLYWATQDDSDQGSQMPRTGTRKPPSASPGSATPKTQLSVPSLYDPSRGWESGLPGTQLTLPHSGAVAVFQEGGRNNGTFTVLDVTSGNTLWKTEVKGPGIMSALSVTEDGKDYLVASASGAAGADVVNKGRNVTTIDIFPARATGDNVKPSHHLELDGDGAVASGGGGLLVEFDDDVVMTVDPATGATKKYDLRKTKPPAGECRLCFSSTKAVAVTPRGPLLATDTRPYGHYWVPGAWSGGSLTTDSENKVFMAPVGNSLVANWHDEGATDDTWAVLDAATGRVRAKVDCAPTKGVTDDDSKGASVSADGRYLVRSHTAFDLEKGTGRCFEETDRDKPVHLTGVTDDGVAFGIGSSTADQADPRVVIDLATGQVEASDYVEAPFSDYSGYGLFWDDSTNTMIAYPHAK